jgi:hypothetical protein
LLFVQPNLPTLQRYRGVAEAAEYNADAD